MLAWHMTLPLVISETIQKKRSRLIEPLTYEQKEYHDILMKGTYIISQNKNGCTHVGYTQ